MERIEVKVLARVARGHNEAGFLKRVLRYDAGTESFFWRCGKRYVQDAALQLTGRSRESGVGDKDQPPSRAPRDQ